MIPIITMYKALTGNSRLLPVSTGFTWWDTPYSTYGANVDREFARRFSQFRYFDFMNEGLDEDVAADVQTALTDFRADVLSILTFNQKRYAEMYRVFVVSDDDDPLTYNYDMTETTGKQHEETLYGATSATKGQQQNTIGQTTDTHNVAPFDTTTPIAESSDVGAEHTDTEGTRTDTTLAHTDEFDSNEWTLKRKGNIGVQTAGDMLRIHTQYWTEYYKFLQLIFDDINRQLLMIGD